MVRVMVAQVAPRKGAYQHNLTELGELFGELAAAAAPPQLLVLPESAFTGYFLEGGVQEQALTAAKLYSDIAAQHAAKRTPPLTLIAGFYELYGSHVYNSAMVASLGGPEPGIRHIHRKLFLPTYGVFDESRFVTAGNEVQTFQTPWGVTAVIVCEDAWHSLVPTMAALDGAQVLVVVSASPARGIAAAGDHPGLPASVDRWNRVVQQIAAEHGIFVILAQLTGFEGGKGLPGGSIVVGPDGKPLAVAPIFQPAKLTVDLDLREVARVRATSPLLADLTERLPSLAHLLSSRVQSRAWRPPHQTELVGGTAASQGLLPSRHGPISKESLEIDANLVERWLVAFLRDEVKRRRGFSKAVIGLSGGVDSAVTAALAALALGPENVIGIRIPYRTSHPDSLRHAELVSKHLNIRSETIDITAAVDGLADALGEKPSDHRLGNIMARLRMTTLFDRSAAWSALPLGTGNKTERLLGYFTWHGDDAPPVNPLGDLFKTQVWALARHLKLPEVVITKPATADLIPGQTDEGDLGVSYPDADGILNLLLAGYSHDYLIESGYSEAAVAKVKLRLDATHWKRRLPCVAMLSDAAIGESYLRPVDY